MNTKLRIGWDEEVTIEWFDNRGEHSRHHSEFTVNRETAEGHVVLRQRALDAERDLEKERRQRIACETHIELTGGANKSLIGQIEKLKDDKERLERERDTLAHDLANEKQATVLLTEQIKELKANPLIMVSEDESLSFDKIRALLSDAIVEVLRVSKATRWRPIATAPKDGTTIVVWCEGWKKDAMPETARFFTGEQGASWYNEDRTKVFGGATHWMPLPEVPR